MKKLIRPLILSAIMVLGLASCSLFSNSDAEKTALATPGLASVVIVELVVQADTSIPFTTAGQIVKYNYNVRNAGGISTAGPVTVTGATCPEIITTGNKDNAFDPNEILVCTSTYTITQADLDRGSITTISMASVNGINSNQATTTVAMGQPVVLKLAKAANPTNFDKVGQIITYTYTITNSGAATLGPTQFTVTDSGLGAPINCGAPDLTLASTTTVNCSAAYTVTQANMDTGSINTNAIASGGGAPSSQPATATVTKGAVVVTPNPPANLTAGSTIQHRVSAGEWLWQIARCYGADPKVVINANPTTPGYISPNTNVTVPNIGSAGKIYGPPCVGTHTVQTGETWSTIAQKYNADVVVLQKANLDIIAVGKILIVPLNSAGGSSTPPETKLLTLVTSASPVNYDQVGQKITYTYVIKNSGSTSIGPVQFMISDSLISPTPFICGDANTILAPNLTLTCSALYTITQNDVNAVSVTNLATASGGGGTSLSASTTINKSAKVLTLTTMANPLTYNQAGQKITYTYVIKNSGNLALGPTQFTITDSIISTTPFNCGDVNTSLAPGLTVSCTATYTITADDLSSGSITNMAVASGAGAGTSQPASTAINKQ